jgi:preprotein translocase subunit SecB
MASDDADNGSAATQGEPEIAPFPLHFTHQYIKDLSFENPGAPQIYQRMGEPQIGINVNVGAEPLGDRRFEVVLRLAVNAKSGEETVFVAEIDYAGIAQIGEQVEEEQIHPLVLIEGPRLLFPFARAILANLTRDSAFPLLMIGPLDFYQMYRTSLQRQQEAAGRA